MAEDLNKREREVAHDYDENHYVDPNLGANVYSDYTEETAAEVAPPLNTNYGATNTNNENNTGAATGGAGLGWLALALSIISLFVMPVLMGAAGIIIGFIARRRGAQGLGAWAIGIGAVSIIVGIFILPFF
ncbi:DUF4190 domain-containing protein [Cytobacillus sp. S13-E01]|uniref:DUF4190 domain-containing protein n=1 Tax=Cytobacillus sp. S13-E01 TaxID=3031326 RepID=UPI0023D84A8A|nr:DUF4190 domain-containing protein [Cytobacillus sp. S13-E01]MDF0727186.1 DUF4190 domain-containing protein [Cytobacillus sp. S13-E01]